MALGRQRERQADMLVSWAEMPRSPGRYFRMLLIGYFEGIDSCLYLLIPPSVSVD
jgi:hypothetical protein